MRRLARWSAPRPAGGITTPYVNTIPVAEQPEYPGDRVIERRSSDEGCETRQVKRTDPDGNTETRTSSNCN